MLVERIIGRVGAEILRRRLADIRQGNGGLTESAAIFRLDKLSPEQVAAIVREILSSSDLAQRIDLKIPENLVVDQNLPKEALTSLNAGAVRNVGTNREALLTANGNEHNLADTLEHVTALGAKELRVHVDAWVDATYHVSGLAPTPDDRGVFIAALRGVIAASDELSLNQLGEYCDLVSSAAGAQGQPIRSALGWALPTVGLPRDSSLFLNAKTYCATVGPWRKSLEKLFSTRAPLLKGLKANGQPLETADMQARFEESYADISEAAKRALEIFIRHEGCDPDASRAIADFEWEQDGVHLIFEKPRDRQKGLAEDTLHFFENECDDTGVLDETSRNYLEELKVRQRRSDWNNEEDEAFYERHRRYLEQDFRLHARWEKIIFGKPIECSDFFDGFTNAAQRLLASAGMPTSEWQLRVTQTKGRKEWRLRFNYQAGAFFGAMYRGLKELMGDKVDWRIERMGPAHPDPLFCYPEFFSRELESYGKFKPCDSLSKAALQIKFDVALVDRATDAVVNKIQLLWVYRPNTIGLSLVDDMTRVLEKGAVAATEVPRRMVSKKGGVQSVSLLDTSTLEATYSRDAGSLIPAPSKMRSLRAEIRGRIKELVGEGRLTSEQGVGLRAAWDEFDQNYNAAVRDFVGYGLHGEAVLLQAESFAKFLRSLAEHARGDICRSRLVAEVLTIGTVRVTGEQQCVIIPPWHPERMKALAVKTRRVAGLIHHILGDAEISFGDRNIFFKEFSGELAHPFYPEIAIATRGGAAFLVSETSTVNGYSLLERPIRHDEEQLSDVNPSAAAKQVRELIERYIALQPHEASNLSILLYNADAAELPLATVRELSGMQSEDGFQCNVAVRHKDQAQLRRVYGELVSKSGDDPDLPVVSETSNNFMSKLRISAVPATSTPYSTHTGFRPFDIAFLHDVVSRTAAEEWVSVEWSNERSALEHAPSRWSYRSVSGENELKSTTFLTCPRQTSSGWTYVDAVGSVVRQQDVLPNTRYLPARRISLQNEHLKSLLDEVHTLAEWVATYDELLDKRQLQANGITVVRYRRASTNGRNMVVSSTSELRLLGALTRRRLAELGLPFTNEEETELVSRIKKDALSISGDIVLRAAKRGVSAGEMLGLVLSRYLLEREFQALCGTGENLTFSVFFLLDDYASWLAQKESSIADILGLCVEETAEGPKLHIAVVESKYVTATAVADARRTSKTQLLATLSTFREALFGDPGRLDRDLWLSRLSDLLLDADIPPNCTALLERARARLREGEMEISLRGYSHVFVHSADPSGASSGSEQSLVDSNEGIEAWQEVFERTELRQLVQAYARKEDPAPIRGLLGAATPWSTVSLALPAPRAAWMALDITLHPSSKVVAETELLVTRDVLPEESREREQLTASDTAAINIPLPTASVEPASSSLQNCTTIPTLGNAVASSHFEKLVAQKATNVAAADDERQGWADDAARKLRIALNGYGLQATILGTRLTPNGCLVRIAGSDRLRVEDIETKRTQLLTTHSLNVVTVQPKPGEIVVTLASEKRQSVSLWDLWARRSLNRNTAGINTSFVLGLQEINGALLYLNLGGEFGGLSSHEPHSLVAGATGSGKSVLIQAILLDIAATNLRSLAQIVLVDPKMGVDYAALENLPHMREPIITTRERAIEALNTLVEEMENRYRMFAAVRARDLATYNAKVSMDERLPMLFLVHDEFADWMLDDGYKSSVSAAVQRLGVKARAAGIHLIFAAQRPDKDVMPMQLRENLGNRLILKVASEATSKIALDRPGAELLLGKGHLAAKLNGEQGLVYAQAPFLTDAEIESAVEAIRTDAGVEAGPAAG